jgi:hypothetical protein
VLTDGLPFFRATKGDGFAELVDLVFLKRKGSFYANALENTIFSFVYIGIMFPNINGASCSI